MTTTTTTDRRRLPAVLRGLAAQEAARLLDGTLPWTWWLDRAARHGRYGFVNTLLIAAQSRFATDVRSYEEWQAHGRQVRKGETGIRILSRRGRPRAVFDLPQTDGLPLDPPPRARMSGDLAFRTTTAALAHQLAHAVRHGDHTDPPGGCHGLRRVDADSVAYLVLARLGISPVPLDFPPVPEWPDLPRRANPLTTLQPFADRILRTTAHIHRHLQPAPARQELVAALGAAHEFFRGLLAGSWVPAYLAGRGFAAEVQREWEIGYAPKGWRTLVQHLRDLGHRDDVLVAAGVARRGARGGLYDTFRNRAMFAYRSATGEIAGFIGRLPDGAPGPKYLNGPETPLFHKGEMLFGLHEARDRLSGGARPVLVEGPLDAIAVTIAGYAAVASCGVSMTTAQLAALGEVTDLDTTGLLVALDADAAGRAGAVRAWPALSRVNGRVDAAIFATDSDPADILGNHEVATLRAALRSATPLADVVIDAAIERFGGTLETAEDRLAAARAAANLIITVPRNDVARQVARTAARLGMAHTTVTGTLLDAVTDHP